MILYRAWFDGSPPVTFAAYPRAALEVAAWWASVKADYLTGLQEIRPLTHQLTLV